MVINGVLGPIHVDDLGQTLIHEHVACVDWSLRMCFGERFFNYDEVKDMAVLRFKEAYEAGIRTIVDGTPINLGRDIKLIHDVAKESGVNIIASTGFYAHSQPNLEFRAERQIKDLLVAECVEGINGTGICPGILKVAVDRPGISEYNRKILRAVGSAAAETGLPVFCHTCPSIRNGDEALDILTQSGVPANRIILGHSGDCKDPDYLESLLEKGAWLGMDRFDPSCEAFSPFDQRIAVIVELCRRGWTDRLFLSHDSSTYLCYYNYWSKHKERIKENSAGMFTRIHRLVIPELLCQGISESDIHAMLTANPKRFFSGT